MVVTVLVFLAILSILVLIHEAGHFFTAKFFGIKVEEFGFGIPPRMFGKKIGETIYSINWLPIGGFVKLYGEDAAGGGSVQLPKDELPTKDIGRTFYARPVWQRFIVVFAGVFMNFVLAVFLVSILFSVVGVGVPGDKIVVSELVKGAPAQVAGLKIGDTILTIDGKKVTSATGLVDYTKAHEGKPIKLVVSEKSVVRMITLTPRVKYPATEGPMGIAISPNIVTKKYPFWEAPIVGLKEVSGQSLLIVEGLGRVVGQLVTKGSIPTDVAGPVGIAQLTGAVVKIGPSAVLSFMSLLSLNLAVINILPIPALDGGRLMFIIIEGLTRKKVSPKYETAAHTIGMAVLLGLIALITLHDLVRFFSGQPIIPQIK